MPTQIHMHTSIGLKNYLRFPNYAQIHIHTHLFRRFSVKGAGFDANDPGLTN